MLALAALLVAACGPGQSPTPAGSSGTPGGQTGSSNGDLTVEQGEPKVGGMFNTSFAREPTVWDPMLSEASPPATFAAPLYPHLFVVATGPGIDPNEHVLEPDLVESWEQVDPTTYVFRLRQNAKWGAHPDLNGRSITADDVVFSLNRLKSEVSAIRALFEPVQSVEAVDQHTVRVTLAFPFAPFVNYLSDTSAVIMPPELADRLAEREVAQQMGGGPWLLESYDPGVKVVYRRNPDYYLAPAPYADMTIHIVPDAAARATAFESKQLDNSTVNYRQLETLQQTYPDVVSDAEGAAHYGLYFNTAKPPWNDPRVRKAVRLALDLEAYQNILYAPGPSNYESPVRSFLAPWALPQDELKELYAQDLTEARRLMADAGYPDGFDAGVLLAYPGTSANVELVEPIVAMLQENLNVRFRIEQIEYSANLERIQNGDFDVAHFIYSRRYPDPDQYLWPRLHSEGPLNYSQCKDPELDRMLDAQRQTADQQERLEIVHDIQRYFIEESNCMIMLPADEDYTVWWPYLKGFNTHVAFGQYEFREAWLDK
jgi:peptide/nickel transport system substrate-binding protein